MNGLQVFVIFFTLKEKEWKNDIHTWWHRHATMQTRLKLSSADKSGMLPHFFREEKSSRLFGVLSWGTLFCLFLCFVRRVMMAYFPSIWGILMPSFPPIFEMNIFCSKGGRHTYSNPIFSGFCDPVIQRDVLIPEKILTLSCQKWG